MSSGVSPGGECRYLDGAHREVQYLEVGACLSYSYPEIRY